jgi:hypothetical protein
MQQRWISEAESCVLQVKRKFLVVKFQIPTALYIYSYSWFDVLHPTSWVTSKFGSARLSERCFMEACEVAYFQVAVV